jgi:hypothetical protein
MWNGNRKNKNKKKKGRKKTIVVGQGRPEETLGKSQKITKKSAAIFAVVSAPKRADSASPPLATFFCYFYTV